MKEYIEKAVALEALSKSGVICNLWAHKIVASIQAADVVEVRHGRWEPGNPICPVCGENKFKDLDADVWADWQPKFCPNCGARMEKEDEHEIG